MATLDLNKVAPEILARFERRARANGRSLADEINLVLATAEEPAPHLPNSSLAAAINAVMTETEVTEKDWQYFNRSLEDIRFSRSDGIQDEPIFGDWYDDFEEDEDVPAK